MMQVYDIAIIGGGIAGVAAAVQTARMGMKTVLIEKTALVGGLATAVSSTSFCRSAMATGIRSHSVLRRKCFEKASSTGPVKFPRDGETNAMGKRENASSAFFLRPHLHWRLMKCWMVPALMSGWIRLSVTFASEMEWLRGLKSKTKAGVSNSVRNGLSMPAEARFWRAASVRMS